MRLELHPLPEDLGTVTRLIGGDDLEAALTIERTIGIAIGVLVERHGITAQAALADLLRVSRTTNVPLDAVAQGLLSEENPVELQTLIPGRLADDG